MSHLIIKSRKAARAQERWRHAGSPRRLGVLAALIAMLGAAASARGQTTYTYTGNPYFACNGAYTCNGTSPYLTVSFTTTLSRSQLANLTQGGTGLISATVTSYTVTDNSMVNITPSSNSANFFVDLSTDANGNPTNWTVYATAVDSPNYGNEGGCSTTTGVSIDNGCNGRAWYGDESQLLNLDGSLDGEGEITFSSPYNRAPGRWVITATSPAPPLQLSNQIFPLTLLGQTTAQTVTVNVLTTDNIFFQSFQIASGSEYAINGQPNCLFGGIYTAGQSCTLSITFKPALPGQSSSPAPISRSAPLLVTYYDQTLSQRVTVNLALAGTGSGPKGVFSPGLISDLVGNDSPPQSGYGGDGGPASGAIFFTPAAITMDVLGNIYVADAGNNVVRVVYEGGAQVASLIALENPGATAKVGDIYTIAGIVPTLTNNGGAGTDGVLATQSALNNPVGVAVDAAGNLYISDSNNLAVRMVNAATGMIYTVAGTLNNGGNPVTPGCCFSGDLGPATQAQLYYPSGITVDGNGNIFIVDDSNNAVRVVYEGGTQLADLIGVEIPGTTATVGDIYTIAGGPNNSPLPSNGDGGLASAANLNAPQSVAVDSAGDIYIADRGNLALRRVDSLTGNIKTVFETAAIPSSLAVDASDNIYTVAMATCQVLEYTPYYYGNLPRLVAGNGTCSASGDGGAATLAGLNGAEGLVVDGAGNLYLLEADGVRFVDGSQSSLVFGSSNIDVATAAQSVFLTDNDIINPENPQVYNPSVIYLQPENSPAFSISPTTAPFAVTPFSNPPTYQPNADCGTENPYLGPGTSCGISLYFQPTGDGPFTGSGIYFDNSYTVSNGLFAEQTIHLSGTGTGTYPTATLTGATSPLLFIAVVNEAASAPQPLTLTNTSTTTPMLITQIYTSIYNFQETNNCGTLLAPMASCTISVTFLAGTTGSVGGFLYVTDNATNGGGTQMASLSGTGIAPVAMVSPGSYSFATLTPGATSPQLTVTIQNTGDAPLTFCTPTTCFSESGINPSAFTFSGNEADQFTVNGTTCGATVAMGASCTVNVFFTPNMPGYFSATLNVNDDSGGGLRTRYSTQTVSLNGHSYTPVGYSSFTVGNTVFPATAVGQSTTQAVTVQLNNSLALQSIGMGSGFTEYTVGTITGCTVDGATVNPPGTLCSIQVTFAPSAPGARNAPLVVTTTESGGTPYDFALTGTGTGPLAALTPGIISNYVGGSGGVCTGVSGEDGIPAANAYVGFLNGMALDSAGNLYISDSLNFVIWHVDPSGNIHLFAGNPFVCGGYDQFLNGNGTPALGANVEVGGPLAVDNAGGLYIGNNADNSSPSIRYINPVTKIITSVLGNLSNTGNQGNGWEANTYFYPGSIIQETLAVPNTSGGGTHNVTFLFTVTQGGTSGGTEPSFPNMANQTVTDGSVIWENTGPGTTTGVGCPTQTDSFGDGCTGTNATLYGVGGIALDQGGNLYFSDTYKYVCTTNPCQTVYNAVVRRMDATTGIVTIYAGNGTYGHTGDNGPATSAEIMPGDLAFDSNGNLYINEGLYVRMVSPSGTITTVAGSGVVSPYRYETCYGDVGDGGPALSASFGGMTGMALDAANNLYLVDDTACAVRRVDAGTQIITTIAGNYSAWGYDTGDINNPYGNWDGSAYWASLDQPLLARLDGLGNIYVMQLSRGVRKINVSESVMNFNGLYGNNVQQIDTASAPLTTTVLNAGNNGRVFFESPFTIPPWGISNTNFTRDVTNPTGSADCYDVGSVAIGYECPVNVDFTPLVAGALTGINTVTDNSLNETAATQTIQLLGTASGTPPSVTLLPFLLSFYAPQGGGSAPQILTLSNNGANPVSISGISIIGSGAGAFAQTNNCPASLAANSSCTISVTFDPPVVGGVFVNAPPPDILTAQVSVTDAAGNSPQIANLIGTGTLPALQQINLPIAEVIHLTDTLPPLVAFTPMVLNIYETIHTTDMVPPVMASTLLSIAETIHTTDSIPPLVSGPEVSLSPSPLGFAAVVGTSSSPHAVTLTNTGGASLTISGITVSGHFTQTHTCGSTVSAGDNCTILVIFNPVAAGMTAGTLSISDNATGSPQTVALSGMGLVFTSGPHPPVVPPRGPSTPVPGQPKAPSLPLRPPSLPGPGQPIPGLPPSLPEPISGPATVPAPAVSLAPSSLAFSAQIVGTRSSARTVTLSNTGSATLTLTAIATSANFGQTNNCGGSVAPKGSCTINVTFSPAAAGSLAGTLTLTENSNGVAGSTQTVTLSGTGTNLVVH
jgi:hypothetical protein